MTETFEPQSFVEGPFTLEDLNQLASNQNWLFENLPKVEYRAGVSRNKGLKLLGGKTAFTATTTADFTNIDVSFGNYFSPGCSPAITATVHASRFARKYVSIRGIGVARTEPDHRGFTGTIVSTEPTKIIESGGFVHWLALGW